MADYRDDDVRGVGVCPECKRSISVDEGGKGLCEIHGEVFASYGPALRTFELSAWVTVRAKDEAEALEIARNLELENSGVQSSLSIDDGEPIDVTDEEV